MAVILSSGINIPLKKRSKFLLAFEERLLNTFNIIPTFENTINHTCRVNFHFIGKNKHRSSSMAWDFKKAKKFVRDNLHIIDDGKRCLEGPSSPVKYVQIVDLDDENTPENPRVVQSVDLTEAEPEIITLDETLEQLDKTFSNLDITLGSINDLTCIGSNQKLLRSSSKLMKNTENEIQIVNVIKNKKDKSPIKTPMKNKVSSCDIEFFTTNSMLRNGRLSENCPVNSLSITIENKMSGKRKKKKRNRTPSSQRTSEVCMTPLHHKELPLKKKRKLKSPGNHLLTKSPKAKPLSDNILNYYARIEQALDKMNNSDKKRQKTKNHGLPKKQTRQEILTKIRNTSAFKGKMKNVNKRNSFSNRKFEGKESNVFNPNPVDVDKEGLRPIIIDGCNVAISHGKGTFSVKGLQICVDYFASRGHDHIKVFLPQHRQQHFTEQQLKAMRTQCDVVFTPSRLVHGAMKTSYDDRFIVQYAAEFSGVVVSNDNYRDLLKENPRWAETIQQRLLMYTWVDDFLMFPVDPLGRKGPTLQQLLRF